MITVSPRRTLVALATAAALLPAAPALAQTAPDTEAPKLVSFDFTPKTVDVTGANASVDVKFCATDDTDVAEVFVTFSRVDGGPVEDEVETFAVNSAIPRSSGSEQNPCYDDDVTIPSTTMTSRSRGGPLLAGGRPPRS